MKIKFHPAHSIRLKGFTLIELLVVIIIIAALAALVVPNVGSFGRSTDMAVSAKCQADITNNLEQFNALQGGYPQGLDSLLTGGTAIYSASQSGASGIAITSDNQTTGLPFSGADNQKLERLLEPLNLKALDAVPPVSTYTDSLVAAGLGWVYDHDRAIINSNLSNTTFRALKENANGINLAPTAVFVAALRPTINTATPPADAVNVTNPLLVKLVPGGVKTGQRVVAFGYGQRNTSIGVSVTTTPLYPGADKTYYGRYIVYFMVYASGKPATLLGVSDAYGRTPDYTQQQFNESLPDGGRQG
jgi:prepilin-type N-terminal cleavage/methylation domain-containing protein